jgi:hypothetical protein
LDGKTHLQREDHMKTTCNVLKSLGENQTRTAEISAFAELSAIREVILALSHQSVVSTRQHGDKPVKRESVEQLTGLKRFEAFYVAGKIEDTWRKRNAARIRRGKLNVSTDLRL